MASGQPFQNPVTAIGFLLRSNQGLNYKAYKISKPVFAQEMAAASIKRWMSAFPLRLSSAAATIAGPRYGLAMKNIAINAAIFTPQDVEG